MYPLLSRKRAKSKSFNSKIHGVTPDVSSKPLQANVESCVQVNCQTLFSAFVDKNILGATGRMMAFNSARGSSLTAPTPIVKVSVCQVWVVGKSPTDVQNCLNGGVIRRHMPITLYVFRQRRVARIQTKRDGV